MFCYDVLMLNQYLLYQCIYCYVPMVRTFILLRLLYARYYNCKGKHVEQNKSLFIFPFYINSPSGQNIVECGGRNPLSCQYW